MFKENNKNSFLLNPKENSPFYYIIKRGAVKQNNVQDYILYLNNKKDKKFEVVSFKPELKDIIQNNEITIKDIFKLPPKKK